LELVSNTSAADEEYLNIRKRDIEASLCVDSGTAYGVVKEIQQAVKRIERIVRKLTYPYLRKVVTHAQHFSTGNTTTFMENYQNGSVGIRIAIGRHDIGLGAFASTVDRWISNRIMTFIRENGMLVRIPDRAFTHKNIVDRYTSKNPQITLEEIAETEGIKAKLLIESMSMVQSQTGYVDLGDEDESTSKHSHDYIDRSTDPDSLVNAVNTSVREYSILMRPRERVLLSIAYGVEDTYMVDALDPETRHVERSRQLLAAKHFQT
jgi:DNA-directed RNA polymerase sigma subunit (sigma70/sigma32)